MALKIIKLLFLGVFILLLNASEVKGQQFGSIIIKSNVENLYLVIDNDFDNYKQISSGDTLLLLSGEKQLRLISPYFADYVQKVSVFPSITTTVEVKLKNVSRVNKSSWEILFIENRINSIIKTDDDSQIYINNALVGFGYYEGFLAPKKHSIEIVHPSFGSSSFSFSANLFDTTFHQKYNQDPVTVSSGLQFLPGFRYLKTKQFGKATLTYLGLISTSLGLMSIKDRYDSKQSDYNDALFLYQNATTISGAIRYRRELDEIKDEMNLINNINYAVIGLGVAITTISIIDGFKKPKSGYKLSRYDNYNIAPTLQTTYVNNKNAIPLVGFKVSL